MNARWTNSAHPIMSASRSRPDGQAWSVISGFDPYETCAVQSQRNGVPSHFARHDMLF
jgi:hypothetical protein